MRQRRHTDSGFTLIELLVVIGVIAIIAAILFPVFAQAREKARQTACLSNTLQISRAQMMYGQDYDDQILPWVIGDWSPENPGLARLQKIWTDLLQPYLKNRQVYFCPSFSEDRLFRAASSPECWGVSLQEAKEYLDGFGKREYQSHFGMGYPAVWGGCTADNPRVAVPGSGAHFIGGNFIGFRWMHLAEIVRPADTTNIGEGLTIRVDQDGLIFMAHGCEGANRHFDGQNMVFLDGHANFIHGNPERRPTFSCGPATIGDVSYQNCLCAQHMTYDH